MDMRMGFFLPRIQDSIYTALSITTSSTDWRTSHEQPHAVHWIPHQIAQLDEVCRGQRGQCAGTLCRCNLVWGGSAADGGLPISAQVEFDHLQWTPDNAICTVNARLQVQAQYMYMTTTDVCIVSSLTVCVYIHEAWDSTRFNTMRMYQPIYTYGTITLAKIRHSTEDYKGPFPKSGFPCKQ